MNFKEMYGEYEGVDVGIFTRIPEVSCYNNNYYIGLKRNGMVTNDLIYVEGDDDNLSEYYHVNGSVSTYIGYESTDKGIFHLTNERLF